MTIKNLSEQEIIRREKLRELSKLGIDAYPAGIISGKYECRFYKSEL